MKKYIIFCFAWLIAVVLLGACSGPKKETMNQNKKDAELTISAAASMKDAMEEIQKLYEKEHPHVKLFFNFGASGALQQQISQGAPVDLFLSAAEDKFDALVESGLIDKNYRTSLVGNELVLVQPKNSQKKVDGFIGLADKNIKKISIGIPEIVPAGKYAKETLKHYKIWESVQNKIIYAKDVRQVLTYVETGNVDAGIVYKTDALTSSKIDIAAAAEEKSHSPIIYPLGVLKKSENKEEAIKFYHFLQSKNAMRVFEKYGFISLIQKK
ncbi:molybdate ABC transporter substrate-binding protein [Bacillus methanolicus]|uniref:molybdate ABC transporter substrate-binding protein n=1 Tax=Bacillus methanolicus TaxID=1471 RepID=UPI00200D4F99|nr:molybdate ABC transporter substrate-binding protein [Bacillus methanolicus]